jgi:hypothetical protein
MIFRKQKTFEIFKIKSHLKLLSYLQMNLLYNIYAFKDAKNLMK